jgi:uncharacterized protein YeaO (DUF488 family)
MIKLKRVYEAPSRNDGYRVLVERLWPRGIRKQDLPLARWEKDIAPSHELRSRPPDANPGSCHERRLSFAAHLPRGLHRKRRLESRFDCVRREGQREMFEMAGSTRPRGPIRRPRSVAKSARRNSGRGSGESDRM